MCLNIHLGNVYIYTHTCILGGAHSARLSTWEMDMANRLQILDEAVSISHKANILRKGHESD